MQSILIVEENETLLELTAALLSQHGFNSYKANNIYSALDIFLTNEIHCVLSEFRFKDETGLDLLNLIREKGYTTPFILITAFGSIDTAVTAMKLGAQDFLSKPYDADELVAKVKISVDESSFHAGSRRKNQVNLVTKSQSFLKLLEKASKAAKVSTSILILGESGTGKELLARYIHAESERKHKPLIALNCGAIPQQLLESELFGHEQGAFTGAYSLKKGYFELASEGTIFLDEIGEMPLSLQVKILRALQEGEIRRLGGTAPIKVNPRIISATNKDIEKSLLEKHFRDDLYYRIGVVTLKIPPLRERKIDIESLAQHFLSQFNKKFKKNIQFSEEALMLLKEHTWPGNIRELENTIERGCIFSDTIIYSEHLGIERFEESLEKLTEDAFETEAKGFHEARDKAVRNAEIHLILKALKSSRGNKANAARLMGLSYKTLLVKIREYQLEEAGV
jgi:two-component system, NtrC family, response regulator AtoC